MRKLLGILFLGFLPLPFLAQKQQVNSTYEKNNGAGNSFIYLYKNGTFLTRLSGGCDGRLESQGKWKINKDTLHFTAIQTRMMDDPWKESTRDCNYLIKKQTLILFTIIDNKIMLDENETYLKVKNKN